LTKTDYHFIFGDMKAPKNYQLLQSAEWWKAKLNVNDTALLENKIVELASELNFVFSGYLLSDQPIDSYVVTRSRRRQEEAVAPVHSYYDAITRLAAELDQEMSVLSDLDGADLMMLLGLEEGYSGENAEPVIHTIDEVRSLLPKAVSIVPAEICSVKPNNSATYKESAVEITTTESQLEQLHSIAKCFNQTRYTIESQRDKLSYTFEK